MKIGIAGTGTMGSAIARRLMRIGRQVNVWNRSPGKALPLAGEGAQMIGTAAQLASYSDIILTILTNAEAIEAVYLGKDGLLSGDIRGKLFVEMSTVRPATEQAIAEKTRSAGAAFIDCPVGGSVGPTSQGTLLGFAGGDAEDVERALPVLKQLCRRVEHMGPVGAGASMKLAANVQTQVYWQAFGEALSLVKHLNIEPARLMDLFADTSGAPKVLEHRAHDMVEALSGIVKPSKNFNIDNVRKDLRTIIEEARALGRDMPVVSKALEVYDQTSREGYGDTDCGVHPVLWSKRNGK